MKDKIGLFLLLSLFTFPSFTGNSQQLRFVTSIYGVTPGQVVMPTAEYQPDTSPNVLGGVPPYICNADPNKPLPNWATIYTNSCNLMLRIPNEANLINTKVDLCLVVKDSAGHTAKSCDGNGSAVYVNIVSRTGR
jgi:hypothetical protein